MSEPFLSEIRLMSFNFAPKGWALCNGQLLQINSNQALFALLGTTYGGDGRVTFALPNLQGKVPVHVGNGHTLGQRGGEAAHTLSSSEMPAHVHSASASANTATTNDPSDGGVGDAVLAAAPVNIYNAASGINTSLYAGTLSTIGGSQAHTNEQPYLTLSYCIALQGIFPSQN
jgi:microcystin-dependent protein